MSFFTHILVKKDDSSGRFILRGDYHYTSNLKAAVVLAVNIAIGVGVEELAVQPYLISAYEAHLGKIYQLLIASIIAFFLTIWWHTGITEDPRKIAYFVIACIVSGFLLLEGFRFIVLW
jgi:hypothetical protein